MGPVLPHQLPELLGPRGAGHHNVVVAGRAALQSTARWLPGTEGAPCPAQLQGPQSSRPRSSNDGGDQGQGGVSQGRARLPASR